MVKDIIFGKKMVMNILENIQMDNLMGKDYINGVKMNIIKVNIKWELMKEKEK